MNTQRNGREGTPERRSIPVLYASNEAFAPIFAVSLQSLMEHASPENRYEIHLIYTDLAEDTMARLRGMTERYPNVNLRFDPAGPLLGQRKTAASGRISPESYYRFLAQWILPDCDRAVYLDCDLVLLADVAELYEADPGENLLSAVRDVEFAAHLNGANREMKRYILEELNLRDPSGYLQAGVLVLNLRALRTFHTLEEWLSLAEQPRRFHDQDVLNQQCEGRVRFLDQAWNVLNDCNHTRISEVIRYAPDPIRKEYEAARKNPKIVHYAGHVKPWNRAGEDFGELFWNAAKNTPYGLQLRAELDRISAQGKTLPKRLRRGAKKAYRSLFRRGSIPDELVRRLFGQKRGI